MEGCGIRKKLVVTAICMACTGASSQAMAAGFAIATQNASGLGNAYAGQAAAAEDASTIFYNPAGMTRFPGRQVVGSINALRPSVKFSNNGSSAPTPLFPLGGNGGDGGGWAAVPGGYLSWEVMPSQLWLGLGVNSPFGLTTEWDSDWVGRFHAVKSDLLTVNINPSVAWKVNEMFSVGAGLNYQYIDAELTRQVPYGAITLGRVLGGNPAGCNVGVGALLGSCTTEGGTKITGDDWSWGWNAGAMINFSPATRLGIAYRSRIKHTIEGDVSFLNVPHYDLLGPAGAPLVAALPNGKVKADLKLPDMLSVGLSHQLNERLQVLADYTRTGWDSIQSLVAVRENETTLTTEELKFKHSWRVGVGVNYQWNSQWKLRLGTAYDRTPVRDEFRTPRLPDEERIWLALGAQWTFSKQGALDCGYGHEFVQKASSNLPSLPTPAAATNVPKGHLVGTYKVNVNIFGVQLRYSF